MLDQNRLHSAPEVKGLSLKKALIAEDDRMVADVLVTVISRQGFTTRLVESAEEGARVLGNEDKFDLLISDVGLAGEGNGFDLIVAAKAIHPQIRSICISGDHGNSGRALRSGFELFMGKPPKLVEIKAALINWGLFEKL